MCGHNGHTNHLASKAETLPHLQDQIATQGIQSLTQLQQVDICQQPSLDFSIYISQSYVSPAPPIHGCKRNVLHTTNTICCETNSKGYRSQATSNSAFASLGKAGQSWTTHGFLWGKVTGKRMRIRSHFQNVTFIFWSFDWMYSSCSMSLCSTNPQTYSKGNCFIKYNSKLMILMYLNHGTTSNLGNTYLSSARPALRRSSLTYTMINSYTNDDTFSASQWCLVSQSLLQNSSPAQRQSLHSHLPIVREVIG